MHYIFLHGLGQTASSWDKTIAILKNAKDTTCPSLFDWITDTDANYSILYRKFEQYCQSFDEPISLCGLSLGGVLALHYAIEHPDQVSSLVLIGTQYKMPKGILTMQNLLFSFMPKTVFSRMGFQKLQFISLCKSMKNLDFTDALHIITCPVFIVCGAKDKANKKAALQLQERLKNADLAILENAGHEVNRDAPLVLAKAIQGFYDNL